MEACPDFILGTTGEGPSLGYDLRTELIDAVCRQAAGRVPVLVGITDTAYERTMAMARVGERSGASAVVLAPPCYFQIGQSDLLRYLNGAPRFAIADLFVQYAFFDEIGIRTGDSPTGN